MAVVEDYKVGDQVIVLDNLQLIVADIFVKPTMSAKRKAIISSSSKVKSL